MSGTANLVEAVRPADWSPCELTLFLRAARSLSSEAVCVVIEHGHSDEGEPWLVFWDPESGEVFGHFARTNEGYVACVPFSGFTQTSPELADLLARFLRRYGIAWSIVTWPITQSVDRSAATCSRHSAAPLS